MKCTRKCTRYTSTRRRAALDPVASEHEEPGPYNQDSLWPGSDVAPGLGGCPWLDGTRCAGWDALSGLAGAELAGRTLVGPGSSARPLRPHRRLLEAPQTKLGPRSRGCSSSAPWPVMEHLGCGVSRLVETGYPRLRPQRSHSMGRATTAAAQNRGYVFPRALVSLLSSDIPVQLHTFHLWVVFSGLATVLAMCCERK